jgi:hypothetical protein
MFTRQAGARSVQAEAVGDGGGQQVPQPGQVLGAADEAPGRALVRHDPSMPR